MDMQIIAIAARRLVVPALFAGITALGITAFAPEAAARDTAPRLIAPRAMPSPIAAHAASHSAATGTYSQRSGESVGTTKVTVDSLKRYSRFNESRH